MERHITPTIIGDHPLAKDSQGNLVSRIATVFPHADTIVTIPGIHATQRLAFVEILNRQREAAGLPALSEYEQTLHWENAVDLVMENNAILIRPDPKKMDLAFDADELLQEIAPKHRIRFLHVMNPEVREAIKRRGECWRITPLPRGAAEMKQMILTSRISIGGEDIYYYNRGTGTRVLTYGKFASMGGFEEAQLRIHLSEIQDFSQRVNRHGHPEISFFKASGEFGSADFLPYDFYSLSSEELCEVFASLCGLFRAAAPAQYQQDDPDDCDWRCEMFSSLIGQDEQSVPEEVLLGMSSEFFMQIEWVPGGRIEAGELIFDTVFEDAAKPDADAALERLCDDKARGFIFNFIREYGDLEYVNIGRVPQSLSRRTAATGRRDVYIAEVKLKESIREVVRIISARHKPNSVYKATNLRALLTSAANIANILTAVLVLVSSVTLAVGGVGIMNIMLANVRSRIREIGIRKALGATSKEIRLQFLAEAVMISLAGGIVGTLIGLLLPFSVRLFTDYTLPINWLSAAIALSTAIAIGVIFGTVPATRAAQLDPVESLKYE